MRSNNDYGVLSLGKERTCMSLPLSRIIQNNMPYFAQRGDGHYHITPLPQEMPLKTVCGHDHGTVSMSIYRKVRRTSRLGVHVALKIFIDTLMLISNPIKYYYRKLHIIPGSSLKVLLYIACYCKTQFPPCAI